MSHLRNKGSSFSWIEHLLNILCLLLKYNWHGFLTFILMVVCQITYVHLSLKRDLSNIDKCLIKVINRS